MKWKSLVMHALGDCKTFFSMYDPLVPIMFKEFDWNLTCISQYVLKNAVNNNLGLVIADKMTNFQIVQFFPPDENDPYNEKTLNVSETGHVALKMTA